MKPSSPPKAPGVLRRPLLLAAAASAAAWLARPARAKPGFGPIHLGMSRRDAMSALGPNALAAPLCAGVEGVLYDWPDAALSERSIPAMAMFGAESGDVSEMQANLTRAEGGLTEEEWRGLVARQVSVLCRRLWHEPVAGDEEQDTIGAGQSWRYDLSDASLTLSARWIRRSGAGFTRLHWLAAGAQEVISS